MGGFSSFALGFSIISILTGITSTYGDALRAGGPLGLSLGWPLVSVGTLIVALAMAELASAFPTAGALYHWAALLGGAGFGWATAMMNLLGLVAVVAAIDLTCAQTIADTAGLGGAAAYAIFAAIVAMHAAINVVSVRLVAWLNDFSATVHIVGVSVVVVALFAVGRAHGAEWLLETAPAKPPYGLGFVSALVLGMWTFTGFDAPAHVAEETHDPARRAPWGIVSAVLVSAVAGFALVCALTLAIRSVPEAAADRSPALFVLRSALGGGWGRGASLLVAAAMWFAGLSSVTSASRMLFAFARDGGVPLAGELRKVSPRWRTPSVAVLAVSAAAGALVLALAPFSDAVFLAVATLSTVAFYASYGLPIALGAAARVRGAWRRRGPFHLGRAGVSAAWAATAWSFFVVAVCLYTTPLAAALLAAALAALALLWLLAVRGRFDGPRIQLREIERAEEKER